MSKKIGRVSLVGAGPGDPGLLTLKAKKLIEEADLVIYDYLANPEHLRHAKKSAVTLCVGKGFRHRALSQEKINRLIIQQAKKGKEVVRLKGGDPYLFGRGAEEALYLVNHRIPFQVVPGVTSATACAAYSGIPLTHREHNSSVTYLTGHKADDDNLDTIDWEKIIALNGTLVIYMGFYNLGKITQRLIEKGMAPEMPAAVIEWGTLPKQKTCAGTLESITEQVIQKGLKPPAMIIIGEVVTLRDKLSWYEKLPLFGKRIVITRTKDKASVLGSRLSELGAQVMEFPTIETRPLLNFKEMDQAIKNLKKYHWLVFSSTYGVESFFGRLKKRHGKDARFLGNIKIAAVGPETRDSLIRRGVFPDLFPKRFETVAIAEEFKRRFRNLKGKKILLLRTNIAPEVLEIKLREMKAHVTRVTAYVTQFPRSAPKHVKETLLNKEIDFVTFSSSSTVENLVKILGLQNTKKIAKRTGFASIGPVTSRTLKKYGLPIRCQAKVFTMDGLIEAIINSKAKSRKT